MYLALLLMQDAAQPATDNTNTIRVVAGVLALVLVVIIILRRKRKASKEDWT
jgi:LPXTG-motif cell wall-anchored protein